VNKIREGIGDKLGSVLHWTSTFISGLTFALVYGWKLALVVIAVSPLLVVCGAFMTRVSSFLNLFTDNLLTFVLTNATLVCDLSDIKFSVCSGNTFRLMNVALR